MGILEKCKRGSSSAGLVQLTTKFTKDPRAGTKAHVRAKTPQAGRERNSSRPASKERESARGSGFCEDDHRQEKGRAGDEATRDRYASETCRNAKRCRPGSGTTALLGKAPRHLRRPRNRRSARISCVFIDDYTQTHIALVPEYIRVRAASRIPFEIFDARKN